MAAGGQEMATLQDVFKAYASMGDTKSAGKTISLTNSDKWLKQAKIIGNKISTVDTGNAFKKYRKPAIDYETFMTYLEDLAKSKKIDVKELKGKLESAGKPAQPSATAMRHASGSTSKVTRRSTSSQSTTNNKSKSGQLGKAAKPVKNSSSEKQEKTGKSEKTERPRKSEKPEGSGKAKGAGARKSAEKNDALANGYIRKK